MTHPLVFARALGAASLAAIAVLACTPEKDSSAGPQAPAGKESGSQAAHAPSAAPSAAATVAAPATASAAATVASGAAGSAAADTLPSLGAGLPAVEDACAADADCGFTTLPVGGKRTCCDNQCGLVPVTKAYAQKLAAACGPINAARGAQKATECPTVACDAMKSPKPRCNAGKCALW